MAAYFDDGLFVDFRRNDDGGGLASRNFWRTTRPSASRRQSKAFGGVGKEAEVAGKVGIVNVSVNRCYLNDCVDFWERNKEEDAASQFSDLTRLEAESGVAGVLFGEGISGAIKR